MGAARILIVRGVARCWRARPTHRTQRRLSEPADPRHRAGRRRRRHRHRGARDGGSRRAASRRQVRHREQARRQPADRRVDGGEGGARRLHAAVHQPRRRSWCRSSSRRRWTSIPSEDFRPLVIGMFQPVLLIVRPSLGVKTVDEFVALRQEKSRQDLVRRAGPRRRDAPDARALQEDRRHERHAGAVQLRRAGDRRSAGRPARRHVPGHPADQAARRRTASSLRWRR